MGLGCLISLSGQLNAVIDSGKYQDISIKEVQEHIEMGDLLPFLKDRLGEDIDLSFLMPEEDFGVPDEHKDNGYEWIKIQVKGSKISAEWGKKLIDYLQRLSNVSVPEDFGTKNSGLCYLLSCVLSLISTKEWEVQTEQIIKIYPELERLIGNWAKLSPETRSDIIEMSKEQ